MTDLAKIAEHNLRTYLNGLPFRNEADREAALACVDVLVDSSTPSNDARDAVTLLEALLPYAEHSDSCGDMDAYNNADVQQCGCGLDSLMELAHEAIAADKGAEGG